ncbi:hypothetical protein Zmor_016305, partial [Zophobas morio]
VQIENMEEEKEDLRENEDIAAVPETAPSAETVPRSSTATVKLDLNTPGIVKSGNEMVNIYDYDPEVDQDKPWRKPGADITDYFNYGFTEDTWKIYRERQRELRVLAAPKKVEQIRLPRDHLTNFDRREDAHDYSPIRYSRHSPSHRFNGRDSNYSSYRDSNGYGGFTNERRRSSRGRGDSSRDSNGPRHDLFEERDKERERDGKESEKDRQGDRERFVFLHYTA